MNSVLLVVFVVVALWTCTSSLPVTSRIVGSKMLRRLARTSYSFTDPYPRPTLVGSEYEATMTQRVAAPGAVSAVLFESAAVSDSESDTEAPIISVSESGTIKLLKVVPERNGNPITKLMSKGVRYDKAETGADDDKEAQNKSVMLFLPGLDGKGSYSHDTLLSLSDDYDVYKLEFDSSDRSTFLQAVEFVLQSIRRLELEHPGGEELVLAGESFGGLLASYVSARMPDNDNPLLLKLLLINPATSYKQTVWPRVGPLLTSAPKDVFPFLGMGVLMALAVQPAQIADIGQQIIARINSTEDALREIKMLAASAGSIIDVLPQATLQWRLEEWLGKGVFYMEDCYDDITSPTLLLVGRNDRLLPSRREGRRLRELLTGVSTPASDGSGRQQQQQQQQEGDGGGPEVMEVVMGGHALLDGSLDIGQILRKSATFKKKAVSAAAAAAEIASTSGSGRSFLDGDLSVAFPSPADMADVESRYGALLQAVSPVFLSLDTRDGSTNPRLRQKYGMARGSLRKGLQYVPVSKELGRPVLFVGNHQLFGADLGIIIREFIQQRDTLVRGLAHPLLFASSSSSESAQSASSSATGSSSGGVSAFVDEVVVAGPATAVVKVRQQQRQQETKRRLVGGGRNRNGGGNNGGAGRNRLPEEEQDLGKLFAKFGAVEVRADTMYRLLAANETVLLFPGGVQEAYHRKGEEYELFWPEKTDFIRMAALHNAIVVPFGAVGVADSFNILLDRDDILESPIPGVRDRVMKAMLGTPQARAGGTEQFVAPISVPKLRGPSRQYFMFGEPFDTAGLAIGDKKRCREAYLELKERVQGCIKLCIDVREADGYADFAPRAVYEALTKTQAPLDLKNII